MILLTIPGLRRRRRARRRVDAIARLAAPRLSGCRHGNGAQLVPAFDEHRVRCLTCGQEYLCD